MTLSPLGDAAVVLELPGEPDEELVRRVRAIALAIAAGPPAGVVEVVAAFGSVAVFFDPSTIAGYAELCAELTRRADESVSVPPFDESRLVEIPVCYGGEWGPDLGGVARHAKLTEDEVVSMHSGVEYRVLAMGFSPGFPYLGGLPTKLRTPRWPTPRTRVPAGSVAIGGRQTGVYPLETPGGWNLIGRTPRRLFRAEDPVPALLRLGDRVRFKPIPGESFQSEPAPDPTEEAAWDPESPLLQVVRPGTLTTVQDLGRTGHRSAGAPLSGAADQVALRIANLLVGNSEGDAALECTLVGPELVFPEDTVIAVTGAAFDSIPLWRPIAVRAGERISFGPCQRGCRSYIAISGGIPVPRVLGSRSTYLAAGLGGIHGRALREGDTLPLGKAKRTTVSGRWRVNPQLLPKYSGSVTVRVVSGSQTGWFDEGWRNAVFTVTRQFDRMGVRLKGPSVTHSNGGHRHSGVVAPGTIQVPGDGAPIVLLADAQTIGGYPRLAQVITADLPLMAQLRGGDQVRFQEISVPQAQLIRYAREQGIALLRQGLAQKYPA